jgi:hypothetical protein
VASYKTDIIERIFFKRWDPAKKRLSDTVVTLDDIQEEIREATNRGVRASTKNLANFFYDIIRTTSANANWPTAVFDNGYIGRQLLGTGQCFEFVVAERNLLEPFPNRFGRTPETPRSPIQTISLPLLARQLRRIDESAILQIVIALRVLETHFALHSNQTIDELTHLRSYLTFKDVSLDAVFTGTRLYEDRREPLIVTCETKQSGERILQERLIRQVRVAATLELSAAWVLPVVVQRADNCAVYVAEFEAIETEHAGYLSELELSSCRVYDLLPIIAGF